MSVLKYKDASGNWVDADSVLAGGQLKIDYIERATENSFDLSKYVNCNDYIAFYENYSMNGAGSLCVFSPNYNADGSQWDVQQRALGGFLTAGANSGEFIASIASAVQHASSLDGTNYNLTTFENNILTVKSSGSTVGRAFVIYTE